MIRMVIRWHVYIETDPKVSNMCPIWSIFPSTGQEVQMTFHRRVRRIYFVITDVVRSSTPDFIGWDELLHTIALQGPP